MDVVDTIAAKLGLPPAAAQAVAGMMLRTAQAKVADEVDATHAEQLADAVPEADAWAAQADVVLEAGRPASSGGGWMGGLAGMAGSRLGQSVLGAVGGAELAQQAKLVAVLSALGLSAEQAAMAAGPVLGLVKERMPPAWIDAALTALPMLAKLDRDGDGLEVEDVTGLIGDFAG